MHEKGKTIIAKCNETILVNTQHVNFIEIDSEFTPNKYQLIYKIHYFYINISIQNLNNLTLTVDSFLIRILKMEY